MKQGRLLLWLTLLILVLAVRWWDPLGHATAVQVVSEPVERSARMAIATESPTTPASIITWPVRVATIEKQVGNAFLTRAEVAAQAAKRSPAPPPPAPPPYVPPPPPPPPVEPPPPLQVIGTWGGDRDLAVFLSGPQGTLLARSGDVLLARYRVQNITKQQVTLLQDGNQRIWNLAVPAAPANLQTWPGR